MSITNYDDLKDVALFLHERGEKKLAEQLMRSLLRIAKKEAENSSCQIDSAEFTEQENRYLKIFSGMLAEKREGGKHIYRKTVVATVCACLVIGLFLGASGIIAVSAVRMVLNKPAVADVKDKFFAIAGDAAGRLMDPSHAEINKMYALLNQDPKYWYQAALWHKLDGEKKWGRMALDRALALDPLNPIYLKEKDDPASYYRASIIARDMANEEKGTLYVTKALEYDPVNIKYLQLANSKDAYMNAARILEKQGTLGDALSMAESAYSLDKNDDDVIRMINSLKEKIGK